MVFLIVLCFPFILIMGYGSAYLLLRGNAQVLSGPFGLGLFVALLTIPLAAVLATEPRLPVACFTWQMQTPLWIVGGVAVGLALWCSQRLTARRDGSRESGVWIGSPGWRGFLLLMLPVAYIVVAEELIWRGYLIGAIGNRTMSGLGLPLAAGAFALHHYHFGVRHVVFSLFAGLIWGGLFVLEGGLYGPVASHLAYNVCAWVWMRREFAPHREAPPGDNPWLDGRRDPDEAE